MSVPQDVPLFSGFTNYSLFDSLPAAGETQHGVLEMPRTQVLYSPPPGSGAEEVPSAAYRHRSAEIGHGVDLNPSHPPVAAVMPTQGPQRPTTHFLSPR